MTGSATILMALLLSSGQEGSPKIQVGLERSRIYQGESVLYDVSLLNTQSPAAPDLAGFTDFDVESAGEQSLNSSRVTIINGRVTRKESFGRSYRYLLTPKRAGTLVVPPPRVKVEGRVLVGQALSLTVTAPEVQDHVVLHVSVAPSSVYPLQPFEVVLRVFVKKLPAPYQDRDPTSVFKPSQLEISWDELPDDLTSNSRVEWLNPLLRVGRQGGFTINKIRATFSTAIFSLGGRPARQADVASIPALTGRAGNYWVYRLARTITAKRASSHRFGPATVKGQFVKTIKGRDAEGRDVYAVGSAAHVEVKPVPEEGKPASFTGAVGTFHLAADVQPRKAKVGDPLTLTLTLTGEGNLEDVTAPDLTRLEAFTAAFRIYEATEETKGSRRLFTYSIRPAAAEVSEIPAVPFSYFDLARERYVSGATDPIPIEVEEAARLEEGRIVAGAPAAGAEKGVEARKGGLFAIITSTREAGSESAPLLGTVTYAGSLGAIYLAVFLLVGRWRRLREDPARVRRRAAPSRAGGRLREGEVRAALAGLVADVVGIPEAGLTWREAAEQLRALGVEDELAGRAGRLIETCDDLRYGGTADDASLREDARRIVDELTVAFRGKGLLR